MPNCAAPNCCNRSSVKSQRQQEIEKHTNITFHRFPKVEDRRLQWANALGLEFKTLGKNAYICSLHFPEESFDRTSLACVRLRNDAVPCVHKAGISRSEHDYSLSRSKQAVEPSTSKNVLSTTTENKVLAPKIVENSDETLLSYSGTSKRCLKSEEEREIHVPKRRCITAICNESTVQPTQSDVFIQTPTYLDEAMTPEPTDGRETPEPADGRETPESTDGRETAIPQNSTWETPRKTLLRKALQNQKETSRKLIQALKKQNRRHVKKIAELQSILRDLKAKNLIAEEQCEILQTIGMSNAHFLKHFVAKIASKLGKGKNKACAIARQYSPELRTFAVTLHYYSPRAYNYVRKHFDSCLPHPKTISEWYRSIDGEPGFINEAFQCITERVTLTDYQLIGTLVFDEMSIRQHVEYDGNKFCGYVDFGENFANDNTTVAKEVLMFMFVCMNGAWKIPIGYFISNGVTAEQKCNLILQSISSLHEAGVKVSALTFDGTRTNLSAAKKLGCNLNSDILQTYFIHPEIKEKIFIILDPSHMVKLVRNSFGDLKVFVDGNGQKIKWEFIEQLNILQTNEGLHAANKLRSAHVNYKKQKMNVRLATQVFSTSVADSLKLCRDDLQLPQFKYSSGTENFLRIINDLFDILNSKNMRQIHFKKPLCSQNYSQLIQRLNECKDYILNLRLAQGERLIDSIRSTGFIGFLVCIDSLKGLYQELCEKTTVLKYIPTYKMSQDHIELFFGCIRSKGGHNNNPTVRQLKSAIKKLLIHSEVRDAGTGNCIPLENITILHVTSSRNSENIINMSSRLNRLTNNDEIEPQSDLDTLFNTIEDHSYLPDMRSLSLFSSKIITYIAGFVVKHLKQRLHCDECVHALIGSTDDNNSTFIKIKSRGGLQFPSEDVIKLCRECEKAIRFALKENGGTFLNKKYSEAYFVNCVLSKFTETNVLFPNLRQHEHDQMVLENHVVHLMRVIVSKYIKVRLFHIGKSAVDHSDSDRQKFNKLTLFRGQ